MINSAQCMKAHPKQGVPFAIFSQIHRDRLGKEGKPLESNWKALFPSRNSEIFGNIPDGQTKISLAITLQPRIPRLFSKW